MNQDDYFDKIVAQWLSASFARTNPGLWAHYFPVTPESISSSSYAVLDPGAAHVSNILWQGFTSNNRGGIIDTISCHVRSPASLHYWMNLCTDESKGSFQKAIHSIGISNSKLSG